MSRRSFDPNNNESRVNVEVEDSRVILSGLCKILLR